MAKWKKPVKRGQVSAVGGPSELGLAEQRTRGAVLSTALSILRYVASAILNNHTN